MLATNIMLDMGANCLKYLRNLPSLIEEKFLRGEHITRHQRGLWNGIWFNMLTETTFMKYGKGPRGLIGIMLQKHSVKQWTCSLHISTQILKDSDEMCGGIQKEVTST